MKTIMSFSLSAIVASSILFSCTKDLGTDEISAVASKIGNVSGSSCANYSVSLARDFADGHTTFVWTITNPNPGNGSNGTLQNLSHWSFVPGCPGDQGLEQNWSDILSADYSLDGGATWIDILPTPELQPDPSQTCSDANVFKFDYGTSGSTPTMYRVILSGNYARAEDNFAIFKSGIKTGCCTRTVPGIGCKVEQNCSLSQGRYFASPHPWPTAIVTVGGETYTEAEGRAIFRCSNKGGIRDSKKGFTQVAAIVLSDAFPTGDANIDADIMTVQNWLATKSKLIACTYFPNQTAAEIVTFGSVAQAAGRIGDWISLNHCN
jgi:hypothetical protein